MLRASELRKTSKSNPAIELNYSKEKVVLPSIHETVSGRVQCNVMSDSSRDACRETRVQLNNKLSSQHPVE